MALLEANNLSIDYETDEDRIRAVNDVSFEVKENQRFGLVGESGCGKTTIAKSILRLLPDNGIIAEGEINYKGDNLVQLSQEELRQRRWNEISIISQSAMNALNPVYTVSEQITEAIHIHEQDTTEKEARDRAEELIKEVGLDEERLDSYPHQLSGGMRQRVMIAMAMALEPPLILADEPTTALDVITQDHILARIETTAEEMQSSLLMITHDISVVAETCDTIGVMYAGELVEVGPTNKVLTEPEHPYTQGLLNAYPTIEGGSSDLITILGEPPDLKSRPEGCAFYDRCPYREEDCRTNRPRLTERSGAKHEAACFVTERGESINEGFDSMMEETDKWLRL
jgi:peptide/nickel transport system ATP-binding protein